MPEYTTEAREPYTGATQRLHTPPSYTVQPTTAQARADIPTWTLFAFLVIVLIIVLSRMPAQVPAPQVVPMVDRHVDILSNNRLCVGVFDHC